MRSLVARAWPSCRSAEVACDNFIGEIQRGQHGHAQRIGRLPVCGHGAHLGVNHRRQLANVHPYPAPKDDRAGRKSQPSRIRRIAVRGVPVAICPPHNSSASSCAAAALRAASPGRARRAALVDFVLRVASPRRGDSALRICCLGASVRARASASTRACRSLLHHLDGAPHSLFQRRKIVHAHGQRARFLRLTLRSLPSLRIASAPARAPRMDSFRESTSEQALFPFEYSAAVPALRFAQTRSRAPALPTASTTRA